MELAEAKSTKTVDAEAEKRAELDAASDLKSMLDNIGEEVEDDEDKYERLSKKQLVEVICTAMDSALGATGERLKGDMVKSMKPSDDKVARMEKVLMSVVAGLGVKAARDKFKDFDEYKKGMEDAMTKYPGIDFDDAYYIAKSKKAGSVPPKAAMETEKPADFGTSPTAPTGASMPGESAMAVMAARGREGRGGGSKSGIVDFRSVIDAGIDKVLADRE
jgi:hypothetical protein